MMPSFRRFPSSKYWEVVTQRKGDWGESYPSDIAKVLDYVKTSFEPCFGNAYVNQYRVAVLSAIESAPMTGLNSWTIFLEAKNSQWEYFIYQFAHEFCHLMIPEVVPCNFRWLEETLCEMASLYIMPIVYDRWVSEPLFNFGKWLEYREKIEQLRKNVISNIPMHDPSVALSSFIEHHIQALEAYMYHRELNRCVAIGLLPSFVNNPILWKAVPYLCRIDESLHYHDGIDEWKSMLPEPLLSVFTDSVYNILKP